MNTSGADLEVPRAEAVTVTQDTLVVELNDGRTISAPLAWFPRLLHATLDERNKWRLIGVRATGFIGRTLTKISVLKVYWPESLLARVKSHSRNGLSHVLRGRERRYQGAPADAVNWVAERSR